MIKLSRSRFSRRLGLVLLLALLPLVTTGCFTVDLVMKVKPDGSGTLHTTTSVQKAFSQQLQMMAGLAGEDGKPVSLFSDESLQQMGAKFGEGVRLVSSERIDTAETEGVQGVFAFDDVRKLRADLSSAAPVGEGLGSKNEDGMSFAFSPASGKNPAVLTVSLYGDEQKVDLPNASGGEGSQEATDPSQLAMLSNLLQGMKVRMAVEVDGRLVQANTPHVSGNQITLLEMDFDKILADPKQFQELVNANATTFAEVQQLASRLPGLKIAPEREVRIEFR